MYVMQMTGQHFATMVEGQRTHTPYSVPHSNWDLTAAFIMMATNGLTRIHIIFFLSVDYDVGASRHSSQAFNDRDKVIDKDQKKITVILDQY